MNVELRAHNRFGLGAPAGRRGSIADPRGFVRAQLDEYRRSSDRGAADSTPTTLAGAGNAYRRLRMAQRARDQEEVVAARRAVQLELNDEIQLALGARLTTTTPFVERLVAFWSNHLCVSTTKPQVRGFAGHYERAVVRPHVLGRFEDMVVASAKHPAMLFYLDNLQSIGPGSLVGRRTARRGNARGLNENYARELLELHTLGVDGGYDQDDVEQLARIFTGWSVAGVGPGAAADVEVGFEFRAPVHEPGAKSVLGKRYREAGVKEGESVIRDLCRHPSTARFVATKLVRHFVADAPPERAVASIERAWRDSDGDLSAVSEALIDLDEAWDPDTQKLRTPQDWLVAVLRAVRVEEATPQLAQALRQLRHTVWAPPSPKGYGDLRTDWDDPDSLMNRAELARRLGRRGTGPGSGTGRGSGRLDPQLLLDVVDVPPNDVLRSILADASISVDERVALAFGGPAFQWR